MQAVVLMSLAVAASAQYLGAPLGYSATTLGAYSGAYPYAAAASPLSAYPYAAAAPYAAAVPVTTSQSHEQDEFGQYAFGYTSPESARQETKTADGVVRGSYSYVDAFGVLQKTHYVADALGFRVAATNLPVAPAARY